MTEKAKDRHLSPTVINGFIICLRNIIQSGVKTGGSDFYQKQFQGLKDFAFKNYKSSNWSLLGKALHKEFFT